LIVQAKRLDHLVLQQGYSSMFFQNVGKENTTRISRISRWRAKLTLSEFTNSLSHPNL